MAPEPEPHPSPGERGRLHADTAGAGPRVALVHGFTQTARCWGPLATDLAADHHVASVDAPGHGLSADVRADLWSSAALVADVLGRGTLIGYSMGGRIALHAALAHPEAVEHLVLISATGGIEDPDERRARREADESLARQIEEVGVETFLDEWLALPLFAGLATPDLDLEERLTNTVDGLASSLRLAGTGTQEPLWDQLGDLEMPVLVVAGERDRKFVAAAQRLAAGIGPRASLAVVPSAGHSTHREAAAATISVIRSWLGEAAG